MCVRSASAGWMHCLICCWLSLWCHWMSSGLRVRTFGQQRHSQWVLCSSAHLPHPPKIKPLETFLKSFPSLQNWTSCETGVFAFLCIKPAQEDGQTRVREEHWRKKNVFWCTFIYWKHNSCSVVFFFFNLLVSVVRHSVSFTDICLSGEHSFRPAPAALRSAGQLSAPWTATCSISIKRTAVPRVSRRTASLTLPGHPGYQTPSTTPWTAPGTSSPSPCLPSSPS